MNMQAMGDIREMSFQNVVDQILKPNKVNMGGFPEDIFQKLSEEEKEKLACNICYMIVNDPHQCQNEHLFCHTCIFAWSMTYGENSQRCPMCRADQTEYKESREVNKLLQDKMVICPEDKCTFKAPVKVFLMHGHGKTRYSNTHVDFEKLRPQRPDGARLLVLPNISVVGGTRRERAESIRSQLQQGRMMIHQMMLLLHLEMQLRQQAVTSFQQATDPTTRLHRLDEVMALNEQLNEVGTVLSTMLNSPINSIMAANQIIGESQLADRPSANRPFEWETPLGSSTQPAAEDNNEDSSSSSSSDGEFGAISSARGNTITERQTLSLNRPSDTAITQSSGSGLDIQRDRSLRRSEIRASLLQSTSSRGGTDNGEIPVISEGRHLSDYSQANIAANESTVRTTIHPRVLMGRAQTPRRSLSRTQNESDSSTAQITSTSVVSSGAGSITTQMPANNASAHRSTLSTTVNARNQTLPGVTNYTRQSSSSNNAVRPNSVARQQDSGASQFTTPTERQFVARPPSVVASSPSVTQRSHTPRPPSSQPSEANDPDENHNNIPRGSTIHREVQQMLNSHTPESNTSSRMDNSTINSTMGSTLSRPNVSNTLVTSTNANSRPSIAQSVSTSGTRNNTNRTAPVTGNNRTSTTTPRIRPSLLTADSANLSNSVSRPRISQAASESSSNNFGSLERGPAEQSSTTNTPRRSVANRNRTTSLSRTTERRPTLSDQSTTSTNGHNGGARQHPRVQQNANSRHTSTQRSQVTATEGQSTARRSTNGAIPKIRSMTNSVTGVATTRAGANSNGRTIFRARRRSDIKEELRKVRDDHG